MFRKAAIKGKKKCTGKGEQTKVNFTPIILQQGVILNSIPLNQK